MCDPVTIGIMLASTAGSTALSNKAERAVKKKQGQVLDKSYADLKGYRDDAAQSFQESLKGASAEEIASKNIDAVGKREEAYTGEIKQADLLPAATSGSSAAQHAIVKALSDAVTSSTQKGKTRAAFDAYGDVTQDRDIGSALAGHNIAQKGSFATGRAGVTDLELEEAKHAGKKYSDLAGIVSALGTVASMGVGLGAPSPEALLASPTGSAPGYSVVRI